MTDTVVHHIRVAYDEDDDRVRAFVAHLKQEGKKAEMEGYYSSARAAQPGEKFVMVGENEFSFSVSDKGVCHIKLRGM